MCVCLVPAAAALEAASCRETGGRGRAAAAMPKGLATMLANLSLVCESVERSSWGTPERWGFDDVIDGGGAAVTCL